MMKFLVERKADVPGEANTGPSVESGVGMICPFAVCVTLSYFTFPGLNFLTCKMRTILLSVPNAQ